MSDGHQEEGTPGQQALELGVQGHGGSGCQPSPGPLHVATACTVPSLHPCVVWKCYLYCKEKEEVGAAQAAGSWRSFPRDPAVPDRKQDGPRSHRR